MAWTPTEPNERIQREWGLAANALYYGDCLDWMRRWDDQTVDLIYLDPSFNSSADYNMLYAAEGGGDAQFRGPDWAAAVLAASTETSTQAAMAAVRRPQVASL